MAKEIRTVVFDMGRVLLDFSEEMALTPWFSKQEDRTFLRKIIFASGDWDAVDAGLLTEEQALQKWIEQVPDHMKAPLTEMYANWHTVLVPVPHMAELIRSLKENGYSCYLLSNTSMRVYTFCEQEESLRQLDGYFVSAEHRLMKPDSAIYHALFAMFGLDPEECFFVDDTEKNIRAAEKLGMRGYHFVNYDTEGLKAAMREQGIRI